MAPDHGPLRHQVDFHLLKNNGVEFGSGGQGPLEPFGLGAVVTASQLAAAGAPPTGFSFGLGSENLPFLGSDPGVIRGGRGRDFLVGTAGDDVIRGGRGADRLFGESSFDLLGQVQGGHDLLIGGPGRDALYGDAGNDFGTSADGIEDRVQGGDDVLIGGRGADKLFGDAGDDIRDSSQGGNDILVGGRGADHLFGDAGDELSQSAQGGDDLLKGGRGADKLFGDAGFDLLGLAQGGNDLLIGGAGRDLLFGDAGNDFGTSADGVEDRVQGGHDVLIGGRGRDKLFGDAGDDIRDSSRGGDDILLGGPGADHLFGDAGDDLSQSARGGHDLLRGGRGADKLFGDAGHDLLGQAEGGNDLLIGGPGNDALFGDAGNDFGTSADGVEDRVVGGDDILFGGPGNDALYGDAGDDLRDASQGGDDQLYGGPGNDRLFGDAGDEITQSAVGGDDGLYGGAGNDILVGNGGNDLLEGGPGDDLLEGGPGDDDLFGGAGNDIALFSGNLTPTGYSLTTVGATTVVVDLDPSDGDDGRTTLSGVEVLRFADQDVNIEDPAAAPVLGANSLTLTEGETVVLDGSNLSASDVDSDDAALIFTVSNVQQGQFELVAAPGTAITSFTQAQVTAGAVQFVHDGGELPPSYQVSVSDGTAATPPAAAGITFTNQNDAPVLGANSLTIAEGETVVLDATNISASDVDNDDAGLIFTVSNVQQGQFELVAAPGTAITSFTQAQVTAGEVQFVHDGGNVAPSYDVSVSDGTDATAPLPATVLFDETNDPPVLGSNSLTISEGETVMLDGSNLSATDIDNDDAGLIFTVSNVQQGQFELVSSPGFAITGFSQAQVTAGAVQFVHDGGELPPSYQVSVSDGTAATAPVAAGITFTNQNDAPVLGANSLTISEGETVMLDGSNISASDVDNDDANLIFTVSNVQQGQFELVAASGTAITSFTQAQVTAGAVQFVHDGGNIAPSFDVSVSDGAAATTPSPAAVLFNDTNDPPVLGANSLTISEGETVMLDGSNLSASDVDNDDADLIFTVSNVQQGQFELVSSPGFAITGFTQAQVAAGAVQFVHDGGDVAPSYLVSVSDGAIETSPVAASITFIEVADPPTANADVVLTNSATVVIEDAWLTANDSDPDGDSLTVGTVSSAVGGNVAGGDPLTEVTFTFAAPAPTIGQFDYRASDGANLSTLPATVSLNLVGGSAVIGSGLDEIIIGGLGGDDLLGFGGADILVGGAGNDFMDGGAGNDLLLGELGDDFFVSSAGDDLFDGGAGIDDALSYANDPLGSPPGTPNVIVNLTELAVMGIAPGMARDGFGDFDRITDIRFITGSDGDDILLGDDSDNSFEGRAGADSLEGGDGFDFLAFFTSSDGVTVDLANQGTPQPISVSLGTDTFTGFEGVVGSENGDVITGDAFFNVIEGLGGDDSLDGGDGIDTLEYFSSPDGVAVDLSMQGVAQLVSAASGTDTFVNFEHLAGSAFGDVLSGSTSGNLINGRAGGDVLSGGGGNDILFGGSGNDLLIIADSGFDSIDGGTGDDTLVVDFNGDLDLTGVENFRLANLERIDLSGNADNTLTLTLADVIDTTDGNDVLRITGDGVDSVVSQAQGWTNNGPVDIGGTIFQSYSAPGATLLIEQDVVQTDVS